MNESSTEFTINSAISLNCVKGSGVMRKTWAVKVCLAALLAVALSGCASTVTEAPDAKAENSSPVVWPPAPEKSRIAFIQTIRKPADIGVRKGFFARAFDFIVGEKFEEIVKPYGIAGDSKGRLIVADSGIKKVHVFDQANAKYFNFGVDGDAKLKLPLMVAVDNDDNIYVSDPEAARVFIFNATGDFLRSIDDMKKPTGLAYDRTAKVLYVSDTGSHEIRVYGGDGQALRKIGMYGADKGEFNAPVDLYVDKSGNVYVNDALNFRIQVFDKTGRFVSAFGRHGDGTGDMGRTKGISMDSDGNIYAVDAIFDTVQIFNGKGEFLLNFGEYGFDKRSLNMPSGIFIDGKNQIFVADAYNSRVQVFEYVGEDLH